MSPDPLTEADATVAECIAAERDRQRGTLSMIASENHASEAVLRAQGSVLTNKYAEGYPGERYYGGCEHVDDIEEVAVERAKSLFDADHANVQPHSGTQANLATYLAVLEPSDTILSLELASGGHLSHGHDASAVSDLYEVAHYGVDPETGYIDYEAVHEQAETVAPDLVVSGYSAYPRVPDWERFQAIAEAVDAVHVADIAHITGLVAADAVPSPVGVADVVTGSTHKTIRAGRGGMVLASPEYADAVDRAVFPGCQGGPLAHNLAGKAVGFREAQTDAFADYVDRIVDGTVALADRLREYGFDLVSGGTDHHFVLVDLQDTHPETTGETVEDALSKAGIVVNKSAVPGDPRPPTVASGVRLGTPALAARGLGPAELRTVADCIARVVDAPADDATLVDVRETVSDLCDRFRMYETRPPIDT